MRQLKLSILLFIGLLALTVVSCSFLHTDKKEVMVMWITQESDPAYQKWAKLMEAEWIRQGEDVKMHHYYCDMGYTYEVTHRFQIREFVDSLNRIGHCPDLILACGDFPHWQLELNDDSLVRSIPAVCFALKDRDLLDHMKVTLAERCGPRDNTVHIHDTIMLQKSLDFIDYLEGMRQEETATSANGRQHRFVTLLDRHAVWVDSVLFDDFKEQFARLDTSRYMSLMEHPVPDRIVLEKNNQGVIQFAASSYKDPGQNVIIRYQPLIWQFYRSMTKLRFVQVKHDEVSRSVSEGPVIEPYYTMTAEDFLINDSCVGGHFASAESLIADAVKAGKRMLHGETAAEIGRLKHTPDYHVNWNLLRPLGIKIADMPSYVRLYNTTLYDRHPARAIIVYAISGALLAFLLLFSLVVSVRSLARQRRSKSMINDQMKQQIHNERLLDLAIKTSGAKMWDEQRGTGIRQRIKVGDDWKAMVDAFFDYTQEDFYQMQFYGSLDGGDDHWYNLRMDVRYDNGRMYRSGFVVNIDKIKEAEEKTRKAHQLLIEARTREGFISSMNHEIRTPLHAVVGFSMELARPDVKFTDEEIASYGEIIDSNAASLKKIINDILLVTLMKNTNISAHCVTCSVKSLLDIDLWPEAKALVERRGNKLDIQKGGSTTKVSADPHMVATVMENLIFNASMFSDEGSKITIGWDILPNDDVEIWVRDEGIGIEAEYYEMIFERFAKINSFTPGCGLGLFICRSYMEKMGGNIRVYSHVLKGSTFTITLRKPDSQQTA